jgi:hypothetical protein
VRWVSITAFGVLSLVLSQRPAPGGCYEQDGASQPGGPADAARTQTQPAAAAARPAQQPGTAPRTGQPQPPGTRPAQPPANPPRTTLPQPAAPATAPAAVAPAAPLTQPSAATAPLISPDLRAELERSLTSELAESPFAGQPGTFGTLSALSSAGMPQMIGDLGPLPQMGVVRQAGGSGLPTPFPPPKPPGVPRPRGATLVSPSIRGIKISEDQSPRPQDRLYFTFNYFQGVNDQVNQRLQAPIGYTQVFRYIGGFEKTFLDGQGSIGLRVPLDSVTANSSSRASGDFGGTSTAIGDMSIYAKYILLENRDNGNLLSGGMALGVPTGPGKFAGLNSFASITNTTSFQPFLGYIVNSGRFYLHGFTAIDVPANSQDVTLIYNDAGIGYFLRRPDPDSNVSRMISTIAPTFEVHVTDPLNHRNPYSRQDAVGMTDIVDLTYGLNIGIYSRTLLTFAVVTPVTSPKPFDFEAVVFLNFFFGAPRRPQAQVPPVVGP